MRRSHLPPDVLDRVGVELEKIRILSEVALAHAPEQPQETSLGVDGHLPDRVTVAWQSGRVSRTCIDQAPGATDVRLCVRRGFVRKNIGGIDTAGRAKNSIQNCL